MKWLAAVYEPFSCFMWKMCVLKTGITPHWCGMPVTSRILVSHLGRLWGALTVRNGGWGACPCVYYFLYLSPSSIKSWICGSKIGLLRNCVHEKPNSKMCQCAVSTVCCRFLFWFFCFVFLYLDSKLGGKTAYHKWQPRMVVMLLCFVCFCFCNLKSLPLVKLGELFLSWIYTFSCIWLFITSLPPAYFLILRKASYL